MDEENPSLLGIAQSINQRDTKPSIRDGDRTKIGADRSAVAIGAGRKRLNVGELMSSKNIGSIEGKMTELKRQTKRLMRKQNKFDAPMAKLDQTKATRKMYYEQTSKRMGKWDQAVKKLRHDEHIDLRDDNKKLQLVPTEAKRRKVGSELERELEQVIKGSIYTHGEGDELSKAETMALESLSIEEAKLRRIELQKHRHLQAAYQQKARRQKKIKSRNFHRHLKRREKKENEKQENDEEEEEDEEAKLKQRATERAELRHATTGSKWSKANRFVKFADGDLKEAREAQIQLRDKLKERKEFELMDDEEEEVAEEVTKGEEKRVNAKDILAELGESMDNEWLTTKQDEEQVEQQLIGAIETIGTTAIKKGGVMDLPTIVSNAADEAGGDDEIDGETEIERELRETIEAKRNRVTELDSDSDDDVINVEQTMATESRLAEFTKAILEKNHDGEVGDEGIEEIEEEKPKKKKRKLDDHIDMEQVMTKAKGGTSNATVVETEDANGASNTTDVTIREAFVDDDVITEFRRDKKQQVESDKPKVVDLILPGFDGEWAGEDFKPSKRQKRRFRRQQKQAPRADRSLHHVIIAENNKAIEKMRIEKLPHPYQNVRQMEKVMAQPLGSTWNTASAVREMTRPAVLTVPGEIVQPATLQKESRFSDIFPVEDGKDEKKKVSWVKSSGKHKNEKKKAENRGAIPLKKKGGRRSTAADDLSLSSM